MNIYDFDGTIYDGDSSVDFVLYVMRRHPSVLRRLPRMFKSFLKYRMGKADITEMKENLFSFLSLVDARSLLEPFWDAHIKNIFPYYPRQHRDDDIIISASPEFLLAPICERLGIKHMIASRVDIKTGKFASPNCRSEEKIVRLCEKYGKVHIDSFYSDSNADLPLARISDKAFFIRKGKIFPWNVK